MTNDQKRWIVSTINTFLAGFLIAFYPFIDQISLENLWTATTAAIIFSAVRAGLKALVELYLNK